MRVVRPALSLVLALALATCGGEESAPAEDAAASGPAPRSMPAADPAPDTGAAEGTVAATPPPVTDGDDSAPASLDDLADLPFGKALAEAARRAADGGAESSAGAADAAPAGAMAEMAAAGHELADQQARMAEVMEAMRALAEAGNDPARREAAMERVRDAQRAVRDARLQSESDRRARSLAGLPEEWQQVRREQRDGPEAELLVQLGDIDNLGFGWPAGFDPFAGKSTPVHRFPYLPEADDPPGTDRIMVVSGYAGGDGARRDGYTYETGRPDNQPQPLRLQFDIAGIEAKVVVLQLFVDDFQSGRMGSRYRVLLDRREAGDIAATLNALDQTGPIGKLLTIQLLPEYLDLVSDGELVVDVDDPANDAGDGFAFDFARLLVNPKGWRYTGSVRGIAVDTGSGRPLAGVLVSAANVRQAVTDAEGRFVLEQVPAGLVVTSGSKPGYNGDSEAADLIAGETVDLVLELSPQQTDSGALAEQLEREGKVDLYGIYFDTAQATLKPESEGTLRQVLGVLRSDPALHLVIAGHTDSEGGDDYNQDLSEHRAAAVVAWLVVEGVDGARLASEGHGEARPVADNGSGAGRALNRRVEVRVAN